MSVQIPVNGNTDLPSSVRLTTTNRTAIFTNGNPTSGGKNHSINSIAIANEAGTAKKVSIEYSIDAGITYFLLYRGSIAADSALAADMPGLPLVINPGGILAATAETANFLTVTASTVMMG